MEAIWQKVLGQLREKTNEHNYNLWFKPIRFLGGDDDHWDLGVHNRFLKDWITDNYLDILERTVASTMGKPVKVRLVVEEGQPLPLEEPAAPVRVARRRVPRAPELGMPLSPRFSFDSFVSGPSNEFACAACKAVASAPGRAYNPLFIYGATGLGKTHLLQAVGHEIKKHDAGAKVAYVTSERFINDMIAAIAGGKTGDFRQRYRDQCDVLLVDDIQFLAGKTSTQEEFFHTFNYLFDSGRQVVVTSDHYPQEIRTLDERLRSRLQSGLIADIKSPDMETRAAILKRKADLEGFSMGEEIYSFLAESIRNNVRELEGALIRLAAFSSLTGNRVTLGLAREVLKSFIKPPASNVSCEEIQKKVSSIYQVSVGDLKSESRSRRLVEPRQVAMFLVKKHTRLSLNDIGASFGGKDHSTVIAALGRVEKRLASDSSLRDTIESLEKQLFS